MGGDRPIDVIEEDDKYIDYGNAIKKTIKSKYE